MGSAMTPLPSAASDTGQQADLGSLLGSGQPQQPSAAPKADEVTAFMQLTRQLEDTAEAIARQHPDFSKALDGIKAAIQEGTVAVVSKMRESDEGSSPGYMG